MCGAHSYICDVYNTCETCSGGFGRRSDDHEAARHCAVNFIDGTTNGGMSHHFKMETLMTDKNITNTAELGNLSHMGLDNYIKKTLDQIADGIKSSDNVAPNLKVVDVTFNLVVDGQAVTFYAPISVEK